MASILDAGLLSTFTGILIFLLVFLLVYGLLRWKSPFGDENVGIYALAALVIALLVSVSQGGRAFIAFITPWYVVLFIVVFFIFFIFTLFGVGADSKFGGESLTELVMGPHSRIRNWIMIFAVLILIAGLAFSFGPGLTPGNREQFPELAANDAGMNTIGPGFEAQDPGRLGSGPYPVRTGGSPAAGQPGSTATPDYTTNLINTIVHPKVLGLLVTFVIAALAIFFLSNVPSVS